MVLGTLLTGAALVVAGLAGVAASFFFATARRGVARHKQVRALQGGLEKALKGEVETDRGGLRDPRVAKGIVFDRREQRFLKQGKLSDEYVAALFER